MIVFGIDIPLVELLLVVAIIIVVLLFTTFYLMFMMRRMNVEMNEVLTDEQRDLGILESLEKVERGIEKREELIEEELESARPHLRKKFKPHEIRQIITKAPFTERAPTFGEWIKQEPLRIFEGPRRRAAARRERPHPDWTKPAGGGLPKILKPGKAISFRHRPTKSEIAFRNQFYKPSGGKLPSTKSEPLHFKKSRIFALPDLSAQKASKTRAKNQFKKKFYSSAGGGLPSFLKPGKPVDFLKHRRTKAQIEFHKKFHKPSGEKLPSLASEPLHFRKVKAKEAPRARRTKEEVEFERKFYKPAGGKLPSLESEPLRFKRIKEARKAMRRSREKHKSVFELPELSSAAAKDGVWGELFAPKNPVKMARPSEGALATLRRAAKKSAHERKEKNKQLLRPAGGQLPKILQPLKPLKFKKKK